MSDKFRGQKYQDYLRQLRRREAHLTERIGADDKPLSYDVIERNALRWALPILESLCVGNPRR